jgi:type III secretory pathway component EscU
MAYSYTTYQKLVLNFSDRTRESNVFKAGSYHARFDVRVTDTGLVVEEKTIQAVERLPFFLAALVLTLIIEVLAALIFLLATKRPKSVLKSVVMANLISLPVVWFIFPFLKVFLLVVVLSELFAIVVEGYIIHSLNKPTMSLKQSFILSIVMNATSFVLGGFIIFIFGVWFI